MVGCAEEVRCHFLSRRTDIKGSSAAADGCRDPEENRYMARRRRRRRRRRRKVLMSADHKDVVKLSRY